MRLGREELVGRDATMRVGVMLLFSSLVMVHFLLQAIAQDVDRSAKPAFNLQRAIERERHRLASVDPEVRRDAVMRLGVWHLPEAARAAAVALGDRDPSVRVAAMQAVLALPVDEAAALLIPLLQDRNEFVRQEAAYALGRTGSHLAVEPLIEALERDRKSSVRGAAAVALGQIGDDRAAGPLIRALERRFGSRNALGRLFGRTQSENEFVRRSAIRSLGKMKWRGAVSILIEILNDERAEGDLRREAAYALGLIGDRAAAPALRAALSARDPYLARIAFEALSRIGPG